jgi:uridine phosphorylase
LKNLSINGDAGANAAAGGSPNSPLLNPAAPDRRPGAMRVVSAPFESLFERQMDAPILERDDPSAPSLLTAKAMLGLARARKGLSACRAPEICVLDPDGDLEVFLRSRGTLVEEPNWGCFHTRLSIVEDQIQPFGIIGRAVGAAFSVLLAEQLFASGCQFLISLSSAGQIADLGPPPYFVVIERALRDEGTSYHYLKPGRFAEADPRLLATLIPGLTATGCPFHVGSSWTTDAPFRETEITVALRRQEGILTVEMEAAGLYAYAAAQQKAVLCLAQVTNRLSCDPADFAKGVSEGAEAALVFILAAAKAWSAARRQEAAEALSLAAMP